MKSIGGCRECNEGARVYVDEHLGPPILPGAPIALFQLQSTDKLEDRIILELAFLTVDVSADRVPHDGLQRLGPAVRQVLESRVRRGVDLCLDHLFSLHPGWIDEDRYKHLDMESHLELHLNVY